MDFPGESGNGVLDRIAEMLTGISRIEVHPMIKKTNDGFHDAVGLKHVFFFWFPHFTPFFFGKLYELTHSF